MREGKEVILNVKLGRLEDGEKQASLENSKNDATKGGATASPVQKALGLEFSGLNEELRKKYSIRDSVKSGVVVTSVDPRSSAAEKRIQPGEVIVEINQEPVAQPADVAKKLKALKDAGKKSALLLVAGLQGDVHFVALPVE
jgi:serine protease Do